MDGRNGDALSELPELPHMPPEELERFVEAQRAAGTPLALPTIDVLRARRRRSSIDAMDDDQQWSTAAAVAGELASTVAGAPSGSDASGGAAPSGALPPALVKVVVLGDDTPSTRTLLYTLAAQCDPRGTKMGVAASSKPSASASSARRGSPAPTTAAANDSVQTARVRLSAHSGADAAATTDMGSDAHHLLGVAAHVIALPPGALDPADAVGPHGERVANDEGAADGGTCLVEVWAPLTSQRHRHQRLETFDGADVFVITFSVKDRASFDSAGSRWAGEVQRWIASQRRDQHLLCEPPVVLVATDAEARHVRLGLHAVAVSTAEAVALAQAVGAAKYVETVSRNSLHASEALQQAAAVALLARREAGVSSAAAHGRFLLAGSALRAGMTAPTPQGEFHLFSRTFTITSAGSTASVPDGDGPIDANERVFYFATVDGSDPRTSATAIPLLRGVPLSLAATPPLPKAVRVVAKARARYASAVVAFAVPGETPAPVVVWDTNAKRVRIEAATAGAAAGGPVVQVRYAFNGAPVTPQSPVCLGGVLQLDHVSGSNGTSAAAVIGGTAWDSSGAGSASPPSSIRCVAIAPGLFASRSVQSVAPPQLERPRVAYSALDGTLTVHDHPSATSVFYFTTDGSAPSVFGGQLYSGPVMIARDAGVRTIRVAAFPRAAFPSRDATITVPPPAALGAAQRDAAAKAIHATKTSAQRVAAASRQRLADESADGGNGRLSSASRGAGSPARLSSGRPPASDASAPHQPRYASPVVARNAAATAAHTARRRGSSKERPAVAPAAKPAGTATPPRPREPAVPAAKAPRDGLAGASPPLLLSPLRRPERHHIDPCLGRPSAEAFAYRPTPVEAPSTSPWPLPAPEQAAGAARRAGVDKAPERDGTTQDYNGGAGRPSLRHDAHSAAALLPPPPQQPQHDRDLRSASAVSAANTASSAPPPRCQAHENTVSFDFDTPIALSHVSVQTPGGRAGPDTYEVCVVNALADGTRPAANGGEDTAVAVGSGELEDVAGVQTLHVVSTARLRPVVHIDVRFATRHGGPFQINDMKVHGKPFRF